MEDAQKVKPGTETARIVSFDLMPKDPDYYFVLTEALRDFAARQRAEADDADDADVFGTRLRSSETAEAALDRIEGAMSTPATHLPEPHVIICEDCDGRHFLLVRFEGDIRFQCANCGAHYIDDEGFGRP